MLEVALNAMFAVEGMKHARSAIINAVRAYECWIWKTVNSWEVNEQDKLSGKVKVMSHIYEQCFSKYLGCRIHFHNKIALENKLTVNGRRVGLHHDYQEGWYTSVSFAKMVFIITSARQFPIELLNQLETYPCMFNQDFEKCYSIETALLRLKIIDLKVMS